MVEDELVGTVLEECGQVMSRTEWRWGGVRTTATRCSAGCNVIFSG